MKKLFLSPIHLLVIFAHLILAWIVVSCADVPGSPTDPSTPTTQLLPSPTLDPGGIAIPFKTLAQGFQLSSAQSTPTLHLALDPETRAALLPLISPEHHALLTEVDLEKNAVLAAIWGIKPSGGFSITIRKIWISGANLTVEVILNEADPSFPRIEAATIPYHLVTIDRLALPKDTPLHFRLVSEDTLLAEGALP